MSRSSCVAVVSVLLALVVTATATASPGEERLQEKQTVKVDAHLLEEAMRLLGTTVANHKEDLDAVKQSSAVATQGDDQSSSSSGGSSNGSGEHSKEGEGSKKEGGKQAKNCLTKELCHKKKIICGKECTLLAHSKCAAKCSKSCVPTC